MSITEILFNNLNNLSKWFYLGLAGMIIGIILIILAHNNNKSKFMENGYFVVILGSIGIISEWTDFANVLFIFVIISSIILFINKFITKKTKFDIGNNTPHYVYYAREFLPVMLVVWVLRAFLFEVYQIPTSSMRPTLTVGDFVLVNKFSYGIREPFTNKTIINVNSIKYGDIVVFKDQMVKNRNLVKRVIGLGGDLITYRNKKLFINNKALSYQANGFYNYQETYPEAGAITFHDAVFTEDLLGVKHSVMTWDMVPSLDINHVYNFPHKSNCNYISNDEFNCKVPQGQYFMMGDNRDNSDDSRYWGFVPNDAIVGKAIYVVVNFHELKRFIIKINSSISFDSKSDDTLITNNH